MVSIFSFNQEWSYPVFTDNANNLVGTLPDEYHIAFQKRNNSANFVDGVKFYNTDNLDTITNLLLWGYGWYFPGYISNVSL